MEKLMELIRRILDKHGNLVEPTQDEVFEIVMADKNLCRLVFGELFRRQIESIIRSCLAQQRDAICNAPNSAICGDPAPKAEVAKLSSKTEPSKPSQTYLNGARIVYEKSLLDFPLSSGKFLRDAMRPDIERQYMIYRGQAAAGVRNALWMRRIQNDLPDDETPCGAVFDDFKIKNYWNLARKELDSKLPQFARLEAPQ